MKRLAVILLVCLLLTGCTTDEPSVSTEPTQTTAPAKVSAGENSYQTCPDITDQTGGAVLGYVLDESCGGVYTMGNDLVLLFQGAQTRIQVLSGSDLSVKSETTLDLQLEVTASGVQISDKGIGYYDESVNQIVFLDTDLRESGRVDMPEEIQGTPLITPDMTGIFFCTADEIRELDMKTGLTRLVRQEKNQWQTLLRCCFDGEVLACSVTDQEQRNYITFLNSETGELLGTDEFGWGLDTYGEIFFLQNAGENLDETLFGTWGGDLSCLTPAREDARVWSALPMGGAVTSAQEDNVLRLDYYDLTGGSRTASVALEDVDDVRSVLADENTGRVFFLARKSTTGEELLCGWDISMSPVEDPAVYTGPRYTADHPDADGLAQCARQAQAISEKYGVEILIGEAAVEVSCQDYDLKSDYRVPAFQESLDVLEGVLAGFPEGFFRTLGETCDSGKVRISLVGEVSEDVTVAQYWHEGDAYVAVALGEELTGDLYNGLFHVMDTYIFNNSSKLDEWEDLNPKGFEYDLNYEEYRDRTDDPYLTGDSRAFVEPRSMSYPREDRASIFEQAMGDDGADVFAGKTMQKKLTRLCEAIRDAFDWNKSETVYPWEQFLEESLAYKGK